MISNYSTRTLIKFDKHHDRNILVLKPNCEFLMWKFPPVIANNRNMRSFKRNNRRVNGFLLFCRHYLAAQKIMDQSSKQYRQRRIRRGVKQSAEIWKIWNSADKQIHFEYEKFAFQLKFVMNEFPISTFLDLLFKSSSTVTKANANVQRIQYE
ncbi:unnamed protein product [Rhizophagus irregularis]|nr:unnamed protein product [Rhizophagus irregularis]